MKKLISIDNPDNWVRFVRGNDGDMHIIMGINEEHYGKNYKGIMHSVRIGVGNSGGQRDIPPELKQALSVLITEFENWEQNSQLED